MASPQAGISFTIDGEVPASPGGGAPQDGQVWLSMETTALVLGVSVPAVSKRAVNGRLPSTELGGRRWFRRTDIEVLAAARTFVRSTKSQGHEPEGNL